MRLIIIAAGTSPVDDSSLVIQRNYCMQRLLNQRSDRKIAAAAVRARYDEGPAANGRRRASGGSAGATRGPRGRSGIAQEGSVPCATVSTRLKAACSADS